MRTPKRRFLTAAAYAKLRYRPLSPKEPQWKRTAIAAIQEWTGNLEEEQLSEASALVDRAAWRYLYFRSRKDAAPTPVQLQRALKRRLKQFQDLRHSLENLTHFEHAWIDARSGITGHLQLDLETAEYNIEHNLELAEAQGFWRKKTGRRWDPKMELLIDCREMMAKLSHGTGPGATKGDGPLAKVARAVYRYAVGNAGDEGSFDRQIDSLRQHDREFEALFHRAEPGEPSAPNSSHQHR
jgi:hypothetical protein